MNRKVIYMSYTGINYNNFTQTVVSAVDSGYNVLIMSFYVVVNHASADSALLWDQLGAAGQANALAYVHSKGGCVLMSVGGATDNPYTLSAASVGSEVANHALANNYDGVDFDLENIAAGFVVGSVDCATWITDVTNAARSVLGTSATITHAPQAPYFGKIGSTTDWTGATGGYTAVEKNSKVDWYNVQYYNQGSTCYVDYTSLFVTPCSTFPDTSIQQVLANAGMSANKIVIGKPITTADAGSGFLDGASFGALLRQGISNGYQIGGYMGWKWETEAMTWPAAIGDVTVLATNTGAGASSSSTISTTTSGSYSPKVIGGVVGAVCGVGLVGAGFIFRDKIRAKLVKRKDGSNLEAALL
jgi:chitinase